MISGGDGDREIGYINVRKGGAGREITEGGAGYRVRKQGRGREKKKAG